MVSASARNKITFPSTGAAILAAYASALSASSDPSTGTRIVLNMLSFSSL
jgi:hypothetical protein